MASTVPKSYASSSFPNSALLLKKTNLICTLPRELRDEIYRHLFSGARLSIRLPISIEVDRIRMAGPNGRQCWPTRDGQTTVLSAMLDTAILQVNKQIFAEALEILINENKVLFVPRSTLRVVPSPVRTLVNAPSTWQNPGVRPRGAEDMLAMATSAELAILQTARMLEVVPASWFQLRSIIAILRSRKIPDFRITHLAVNFGRLLYDYDSASWPDLDRTRYMLSAVSKVKVTEEAKIIWPTNPFDSHQPIKSIIEEAENSMVGSEIDGHSSWLLCPPPEFAEFEVLLDPCTWRRWNWRHISEII